MRAKNSTKRRFVSLLKGPLPFVKTGLAYWTVNQYEKEGLLTVERPRGGKGNTVTLTTKGAALAAQWDYELKLENSHPDQEEPLALPESPAREGTLKERLLQMGATMEHNNAESWKKRYFEERERHVEFLEEIVRNISLSKHL